jgi:uncharacterized protein YydD (DUF2326 family)
MIRRISANHASFREVAFRPGFNLIVAERSDEATDRDSRNGLGKSTLLEIIHFCLGSRGTKGEGVVVETLNDWVFRLDLRHGGQDYAFSRGVADTNWLDIDSKYDDWPVQPTIENGSARLSVANQRVLLGHRLFGLTEAVEAVKFGPTYRSLVSYLMRRSPDGFLDPFSQFRTQRTWDKQVNVAFHLDLNWRDATEFQALRTQKATIDELEKVAKKGDLPSYLGSEGELEAERVRLTAIIEERSKRIATFRVLEDYREIEKNASVLAEKIHDLVNQNIGTRRRIELYSDRMTEERASLITGPEVETLYKEAGVVLPDGVHRRLVDLKTFHDAVVENRSTYLNEEIQRLTAEAASSDATIKELDHRKSELMSVLESSGALEEFMRLQDLLVEVQKRLGDVESRLARLREVTRARADWEERKTRAVKDTRTHYDELKSQRDRAIAYFHANTEALYEAAGRLIIDVDENGFSFDVKIDRSDSHGVSNMKIFCFDLMLMQLWSARSPSPGLLLHDSTIFDGVDERQVAAALTLAHTESERLGFQYICALNSDDLPRNELAADHPVFDSVALHLHDHDPSGRLLGIEF